MRISIFLFVFLSFVISAEITEIRELYKMADLSEDNAVQLELKLQEVTKSDDKVLVAYKGAVNAMLAKYEKGVKNKKERFKNGVALLEYAAQEDVNNIEIIFVRLSVQQNSPKFLNYNKNIEVDKSYLLNNYPGIASEELRSYIKEYILHSNNFSEEEKNVISQP